MRRLAAAALAAAVAAAALLAPGPAAARGVFGFADTHLHITAHMRAGGRVIHGEAFDPRGIAYALDDGAADHGPDGTLDITGNLLRTGLPIGTHDTRGWPTFRDWPSHDTITHQQVYWTWLERAWRAGLRLVVAQTADDDVLCRIEPLKAYPTCDETASIVRQVRRLRALEAYVDEQSGGPGRGWFRIVLNPRQARRVIEAGKLAVVIGVESSNLLGCHELPDGSPCTPRTVDAGVERLRRLGVRSVFLAHWVDNGFAGAALEQGARGDFIGLFELLEDLHPFATGPCPDPREGAACNTKGLTPLGAHLARTLMDRHMLVEADHLSEKARAQLFGIAAARDYPLVSSHTGTGGAWTPEQLRRLHALGGLAAATPDTAPEMVGHLDELERYGSDGGPRLPVALGTDTGGFAELPGPRPDAAQHRLAYPFRSYDGRVAFERQRTGERTFDLNTDGVAHYGLIADLIADIEQQPGGRAALRPFFHSAEAYLGMWEKAEAFSR